MSDGFDETEGDKRGIRRDRVVKRAQVTFGNSVLDCIVLDISIAGARISFANPVPIPEAVALRLHDGSIYPARRRWARGTDMGLEFIGLSVADGNEGQLRQAAAAMQAVLVADPSGWLRILRAERYFGDETLRRAAEAAEAAHKRLAAALQPHAVRRPE
jgi:PilZ domain